MVMEQKMKKLRLIVNGAIVIYENEGQEIASSLEKPELLDAQDTLGTALYWMRNEIDETEK